MGKVEWLQRVDDRQKIENRRSCLTRIRGQLGAISHLYLWKPMNTLLPAVPSRRAPFHAVSN